MAAADSAENEIVHEFTNAAAALRSVHPYMRSAAAPTAADRGIPPISVTFSIPEADAWYTNAIEYISSLAIGTREEHRISTTRSGLVRLKLLHLVGEIFPELMKQSYYKGDELADVNRANAENMTELRKLAEKISKKEAKHAKKVTQIGILDSSFTGNLEYYNMMEANDGVLGGAGAGSRLPKTMNRFPKITKRLKKEGPEKTMEFLLSKQTKFESQLQNLRRNFNARTQRLAARNSVRREIIGTERQLPYIELTVKVVTEAAYLTPAERTHLLNFIHGLQYYFNRKQPDIGTSVVYTQKQKEYNDILSQIAGVFRIHTEEPELRNIRAARGKPRRNVTRRRRHN